MGGRFASTGRAHANFFPGQGAIAGMLKTIAREWTSVRTRVIDLDMNDGVPRLAERLLAEIFHDDAWTEVGYRAAPDPAADDPYAPGIKGRPGYAILAPGRAGAHHRRWRGITSLVAAELARRWQPEPLLIGTTPSPDGPIDAELDGLDGPVGAQSRSSRAAQREGAIRVAHRARAGVPGAYGGRGKVRRNLERLRALGSRGRVRPGRCPRFGPPRPRHRAAGGAGSASRWA